MVGQKIKKGSEMIKFERLTKARYEECFSNMNREMNLVPLPQTNLKN